MATDAEHRPTAAVAGAGLSGLSAAYRLREAGWEVTVFEAEALAGGRVATVAEKGYLADTAATTVPPSYRAYRDLAAELGLRVVEGPPYFGVYRDGRIHLLRLDRVIRSGLATELLSWRSKLRVGRLALDVARAHARGRLECADLRKAAPLDTESIREYALRVLDADVDMYLCEPIARAMQIADSDKVSKVELFSALGVLLKGGLGCTEGGQVAAVDALVERVGARVSTPVTRVQENGAAVTVSWRDPDGSAHQDDFDACVVACPLPGAAAICPGHPALEPMNGRFTYNRTLSVAIGTTRAPDCPAFMVQLPRSEDRDVVMVFLDHNKAPDRAPAGHGLFGVTWEMTASEEWFERSDEDVVQRTLQTLDRLFPGVAGTVDFTHVKRWGIGLPHLPPGAIRLMAELHERLDPGSRIQFACDFMTEPGQDSAVTLGTRAAHNLERVRQTRGPAGAA